MIKPPASSKDMKQKQQQKQPQPQPQPQPQKQNLLGKWGEGWSLGGALDSISSGTDSSASRALDRAARSHRRMTHGVFGAGYEKYRPYQLSTALELRQTGHRLVQIVGLRQDNVNAWESQMHPLDNPA